MTATMATDVFCPDWCTMPMSEHLAELAHSETARHESADGAFASVAQCFYPDGTTTDWKVVLLILDGHDLTPRETLTPERCRQMAMELNDAADVMESQR